MREPVQRFARLIPDEQQLFGPLHRNLLAGVTELIASDHWRVAGMLSLQPFGSWESYRCQAAGGKTTVESTALYFHRY
jgi:hypothetical protein